MKPLGIESDVRFTSIIRIQDFTKVFYAILIVFYNKPLT